MKSSKIFLFVFIICVFLKLPSFVLGADEVLKIKIGTSADYPPYESIDSKTGEIVGFDIDLMNAIAKEAGFEVEYVSVDFNRIFPGLENDEYDAIISALTITDERKEHYDFSDSYITITADKSKKGSEDTENYGIAVKKGNKEILDLINKGLKEVMEDDFVDQLKKKWKIKKAL